MADCLVDTDVISYLFRNDTRAEAYRTFLINNEPAICFQTLAELRRWAHLYHWGASRWRQLERLLAPFAVSMVDEAVITAWAEISVHCERQGRPITTGDAWIAASALVQGVPLVTQNRRHYETVAGLVIVSDAP